MLPRHVPARVSASSMPLRSPLLSQPPRVTVASTVSKTSGRRWAMARGSDPYSSYREWEKARLADQRAKEQATRRQEQERKAREREQAQADATARDEQATARNAAVEQRIEKLETLLRSSLTWDPRISLTTLRRRPDIAPPDLGSLAVPEPVPDWTDFAPEPPRGLARMLGGRQRHEMELRAAEDAFAKAQDGYREREASRQARLARARRAYGQAVADAERDAATHNAHLDRIAAGLRDGDRHAVSDYMEIVLAHSPYPDGFPTERHAGYVPESSLLAVEWYLPPVEIVPEHKSFRHIKTRKAVEPTIRPLTEIRQIYQRVIAQIALRTLREVFDAAPAGLISTIVFNGRVHAVDPVTGRRIQPHLITLRATREQFQPLVLSEPSSNPSSASADTSSPTSPPTPTNWSRSSPSCPTAWPTRAPSTPSTSSPTSTNAPT
ncbi:hypothetical protein [Actinomadura rubrisoli]|uniref:hypothetical protein n=1 Tax=Actinomadura rubrisoli TaxID=2530368 RepID=UPI001A9FCBF4|nr:hypothetical protein [Actinomadura rubrisoli]